MVGDSEATRRRLLDAAADEFSRYGIAGARVDRIATAARVNKAQIYQYFDSKDQLFDAVMDDVVTRTAAAVQEAPIDPADLPGYAGRLFDGYEKHPELLRMATWYRLERGGEAPLDTVVDNVRDTLDAIAAAQARGDLPSGDDPVTVLGLVLHLAQLWSSASPEFNVFVPRLSREQRRAALVDAVRRVLTY